MTGSSTSLVAQTATSSDYKFVVIRSDDGNASIALQHLVKQANGTSSWQTVNDAQGAISQSNAGWDDAIPWAAGTYDLTYAGAYAGAPNSWRVSDTDPGSRKVAQRDGIRLHQGSVSSPSQALEGCIGATASFLSRAYSALSAAGEATTATRIPMDVSDSGQSFYPLGITETVDKSSLNPGEAATVTISLTGGGTANGVTKDIFFHVGATKAGQGSTASYGTDYSITSSDGGKVVDSSGGNHAGASWPGGEYLELPAGQNSVTYTITDNYQNTQSGAKTADLAIDNYYVVRVYKGVPTPYSDHATPKKIILQNSSIGPSVITLNGQTQLPQQISGDIQGLHRTFSVVKGDTIKYDFQAYTIPDDLSISDGVSTYGTGGFVSDDNQGSFIAGSNQIQVNVTGSEVGTAWDLSLTESPSATHTPAPSHTSSTPPARTRTAGVRATATAMTVAASTLAASGGSAATLNLIGSWNVNVPSSGNSTAVGFTAVAGNQYLARIIPNGTQSIGGDSLSIFEGGSSSPFLTSSDSTLADEPAASFSVNKNETVNLTASGSASGPATIQVFDASSLKAPLLYFENDPSDQASQDNDQGVAIHLHRLGDLSQSATYNLLIQPTGTSPLSASDVGGNLSIPITFAAGDDIATAIISPTLSSGFSGVKTAIVTLDPNSTSAETLANDQILGLQSSVNIAIASATSSLPNIVPVITSADSSATNRDHSISFDVHLSAATSLPVYLSYSTIDQTAIAGQDYVATSGVLSFSAGQTDATVTVNLDANNNVGADKTFGLNLIAPFNSTFSSGSVITDTGTIHEIGPAFPQLSVDPTTAGFLNARTPILTGTVASTLGLPAVEIFEGDPTNGGEDLGAATVSSDGTWQFNGLLERGDYNNLTVVATDALGQSTTASAPFEVVTGVTGQPYHAIEYDYTPDGSYAYSEYARNGGVLVTASDNGDGTHQIVGLANQQSLDSIYDDLMTGGGTGERFVFNPQFGHDEITDFIVGSPAHDTIDLSGTRYTSLAQVLQHTMMSDGSATIHLNPTDSITLDGVTKGQLKNHANDIAVA